MGNITDQSVFGNYSQKENQVTCALLKILEADEDEALLQALLREIGGECLPEKTLKIETQGKNPYGRSVPDGHLSCHYAFDIYIESKLGTIIDRGQLVEHTQLLETDKNVKLIYITQHSERPNILPEEVLWTNWTKIYEIVNRVHEDGVNPVMDYLIEQFYLLLRSLKLYDDSKNRVIIVGGSWGEQVALEYGFYACQADRSFKKAKYIAFYHQHRICYLFEIEGEPISNVNIRTLTDIVPEEYFLVKDPNYEGERTFFKLKKAKEFSPAIKNDKESCTGKPVAFTQKQTYTTYEKIMKAKTTSDLK